MDFAIEQRNEALRKLCRILKHHYFGQGDDLMSLVSTAKGLTKKDHQDLKSLINLSRNISSASKPELEQAYVKLLQQLSKRLDLGLSAVLRSYMQLFLILSVVVFLVVYQEADSFFPLIIILPTTVLLSGLPVAVLAYLGIWLYRMLIIRYSQSRGYQDSESKRSQGYSNQTSSGPKPKQRQKCSTGKENKPKFKNATDAGLFGEMEISFLLRTTDNERVLPPISTENLVLNGHNFEIDLLVPIDGVGLVLMEVKNLQGKLLCMSDDEWIQVKPDGEKRYFKGATKQVTRTRKLLQKALERQGLNLWDIIPVVVLANQNTELVRLDDKFSPHYTDIVSKEDIVDWLDKLPVSSDVKVTSVDVTKIHMALLSIQKEFQIPTEEVT